MSRANLTIAAISCIGLTAGCLAPIATATPIVGPTTTIAFATPTPAPTWSPPPPTPEPPPILDLAELIAFANDPAAFDDIVIGRVRLDPGPLPTNFEPYENCWPVDICPAAMINDADPPILVFAGSRRTADGDGTLVQRADGSGSYWATLLTIPTEPTLAAFTSGGNNRLSYLGPVVDGADEVLTWSVDRLLTSDHATPSDELYSVNGWMVSTGAVASCPAPSATTAATDNEYWCGGSFITQDEERLETSAGVTLTPHGLHVEWHTYYDLFPNAKYEPGEGLEPRHGTYVVRSAGCPHAVMGDCPVWSFVGKLETPADEPVTSPPPSAEPVPSQALPVMTAAELLALVGDPSALGRVVLANATLTITPGPPSDPRCVGPRCTIASLVEATSVTVFARSPVVNGQPTLAAYRVIDAALELISPVALVASGSAWTVDQMLAADTAASLLYPVGAWLTQSDHSGECEPPPDMSPDANFEYWCGASWLTGEPIELSSHGTQEDVPASGLQVQGRAYMRFADTPADGSIASAWDVYLIRQAGCPTNHLGPCPVWEVVSRLAAPGGPAHPPRGDCVGRGVIVDGPPMTPQQIAQSSSAVAVGKVLEIGPGFWDSATGDRPISFTGDDSILTLVRLDVEQTLGGDGAAAEVAVKHGGTYGCDSESYDPSPWLSEGLRYVTFMSDWPFYNPDLAAYPTIEQAWPVAPDGRVLVPNSNNQWLELDQVREFLFPGE